MSDLQLAASDVPRLVGQKFRFRFTSQILDVGTCFTKFGVCEPVTEGLVRSQKDSRAAFPSPHVIKTLVGRTKGPGIPISDDGKRCWLIGDDAVRKRGLCNFHYPIENGNPLNWNDISKIWHHVIHLSELHVIPEDYLLLLSEPFDAMPRAQKTSCEVAFETFGFKGMFSGAEGMLSLVGNGETTGVSIGLGGGYCSVLPVSESQPIRSSGARINFGGFDIFQSVLRLLRQRIGPDSYSYRSLDQTAVLKSCYVALDVEDELVKSEALGHADTEIELPDGQTVLLKDERFQIPECLFNPRMGTELETSKGIQEIVQDCFSSLDAAGLRSEMGARAFVNGGLSLLPGLIERLRHDVVGIEIIAMPGAKREYAGYLGGRVLSMLTSFDNWIMKEEFAESGSSIVPRRGFS